MSEVFRMENKIYNCPNRCDRYSRTIDEIFHAGNKHKEKLISLKEVAENQKEKISLLRDQKSSLQYQVDQLQSDLEIEKDLAYKIQMEDLKRIKKLKVEIDCLKDYKECEEKSENFKENGSMSKEIEDLKAILLTREKELEDKESKNEELSNKIGFLKPRLEFQNLEDKSRDQLDAFEKELSRTEAEEKKRL